MNGDRRVPDWNTTVEEDLARYVDVESARRSFTPVGKAKIEGKHSLRELAKNPDTVVEAARVIYDHLAAEKIGYDEPGYSPNGEGMQRVFLPHEVIERSTGTCVDLAVAYSALALDAGLQPLLIGTEGHVFAAVQTSPFRLSFPEQADLSEPLRKYIEQGSIVPIETTRAVRDELFAAEFDVATDTATKHAKTTDIKFVLDIRHLQQERNLRPPPQGDTWPPPSGPPWPVVVALAVFAGIGLVTAALLLWPGQQAELDGLASRNVVVFPFKGEGDEQAASTEVSKLLEAALDDTWTVEGPAWSGGGFPTGDFTADQQTLHDRNIGYGIFGTVDPDKPDEVTSISVWFSPDVVGAELLGIVGPVVWLDDIPNLSASARAGYAANQIDNFSQLLGSFETLSGALTDQALLEARDTLVPLTDMVEPRADDVPRALAALARGYVGQISLVRAIYHPPGDPDAANERQANIMVAQIMFEAIVDDARTDLELARAHIGLTRAELANHGCIAGGGSLTAALVHLGNAQEVDRFADDETGDIALRVAVAEADLAWCGFNDRLVEAADAEQEQTDALLLFQGRSDDEQDRTEFLVADVYYQRALLRSSMGTNAAGCASDFEEAIALAPPLHTETYEQGREDNPCAA